jgi:hypothetical protein
VKSFDPTAVRGLKAGDVSEAWPSSSGQNAAGRNRRHSQSVALPEAIPLMRIAFLTPEISSPY